MSIGAILIFLIVAVKATYSSGQVYFDKRECICAPSLPGMSYKSIPDDYYPNGETHIRDLPRGLEPIRRIVEGYKWTREPEDDVWDCTEMSAFLERELEINHIPAIIAKGGGHSWVIAYYFDEEAKRLEAIAIDARIERNRSLIFPLDDVLEEGTNYYSPKHVYCNIYEAVESFRGSKEFDWWNIVSEDNALIESN